MMTIKTLYTNAFAPNPLRVNLMLKLKGIELETIHIDLMKGEQLLPDYKKIIPEGTVPALILDDGTILTDVVAILYFLEKTYPDTKNLMGHTACEQAQILGMIHHIHFTGLMSVAEIFRNGFLPGFEGRALPAHIPIEQIPELMDRGRTRIHYFYEQINIKLGTKDFLIGEHISQADIDLYVLCNFASWVKETFDPKVSPNLAAHHARVGKIIESC